MRYVLAAFGTAALIIFTVPAVHASSVDAAAQSLADGQVVYAKKGGWHGGGKGWKHGWKGGGRWGHHRDGGEVRHHGHQLGGIGESTADGRGEFHPWPPSKHATAELSRLSTAAND